MDRVPRIDGRLCTLCGDCVAVCPTECLVIVRPPRAPTEARHETISEPAPAARGPRGFRHAPAAHVPLLTRIEECVSCDACTAVCLTGAVTLVSPYY